MRIMTRIILILAMSAALMSGAEARAAATPSEIASKGVAKMRAISAKALRDLTKQERIGAAPLRRTAEGGADLNDRASEVRRRAAKVSPIAEAACRKLIRERDRALGRLLAVEGTANAADVASARALIRAERDALLSAIGGRADDVAENLALAAALDPGDRDELDTLIPGTPTPSCDVDMPGG